MQHIAGIGEGMIENSALYSLYELQQATVAPLRMFAHASKQFHSNPYSPLAYTTFGRSMSASFEMIERFTKKYAKPVFGLLETEINGKKVAVREGGRGPQRYDVFTSRAPETGQKINMSLPY